MRIKYSATSWDSFSRWSTWHLHRYRPIASVFPAKTRMHLAYVFPRCMLNNGRVSRGRTRSEKPEVEVDETDERRWGNIEPTNFTIYLCQRFKRVLHYCIEFRDKSLCSQLRTNLKSWLTHYMNRLCAYTKV